MDVQLVYIMVTFSSTKRCLYDEILPYHIVLYIS